MQLNFTSMRSRKCAWAKYIDNLTNFLTLFDVKRGTIWSNTGNPLKVFICVVKKIYNSPNWRDILIFTSTLSNIQIFRSHSVVNLKSPKCVDNMLLPVLWKRPFTVKLWLMIGLKCHFVLSSANVWRLPSCIYLQQVNQAKCQVTWCSSAGQEQPLKRLSQ